MMPGTTVRPLRSMTRAPGPGVLPTATNRPLLMDELLATVFARSSVWMRPLTNTRSAAAAFVPRGDCAGEVRACGVAERGAQPSAADTPAAAPTPSTWRRDRRLRMVMMPSECARVYVRRAGALVKLRLLDGLRAQLR